MGKEQRLTERPRDRRGQFLKKVDTVEATFQQDWREPERKVERCFELILDDERLTPPARAEQLIDMWAKIRADEEMAPERADEIDQTLRQQVLPELLGEAVYTQYGRELARRMSARLVEEDELFADDTFFPELGESTSRYMLERFVDADYVKRKTHDDSEGVTLNFKGKKAAERLTSGAIHAAQLAHRMTQHVERASDAAVTLDSMYAEHNKRRAVTQLDYVVDKDSYTVLPINELRLGHQDGRTGVQLVREVIEGLRATPVAERPDVIVVSNLIQGDFSHSKSKRRPVLVEALNSNDAQFREAKAVLDDIKSLGIPVVHNLGSDDLQIAEDYTKDVVSELSDALRSGSASGHIPYYEQNKLTQNKLFQEYYQFQLRYALPLCYRLGRRLRSTAEIKALTEGEVEKSEFRLLYEHLELGEPLPSFLELTPDDLVRRGKRYHDGSVVTCDVDLVFHTLGGTHNVQYRHNAGFTPESLTGGHMKTPLDEMGNLGYMGENVPELFMSGRAQELVYATSSRASVLSLPGLTDPTESLRSDASHSQAPGDPSRRFNATRRRLVRPAIDTVEMKDNGNVVHHIYSGKLMEKSRQLPRMAIFELCDFQTGSPTARPDYQVKFLAQVLDTARDMPVALHFAGDIIHGNIYANMAHEAQSVGLMRPESQKLALSTMLRQVFEDAPAHLVNAVVDVLVQQGNHDELQRVKSFGTGNNDPNIDYLIRDCKDLFETPATPGKVRHDAVFSADGTLVPTWTGRSHYGDFSMNTAHYHLNRGAKGDSGGLPVFHPLQRARGIGSAETPDILLGAHWHNEQVALVGDVVSIVGGAMAGRSEFEDGLGYDARVAGTVIKIGGGQPVSVEFVHERALIEQVVRHGAFTQESLNDHGFHDDAEFDPYRHGILDFDDLPKSALQKAILKINRQASQRVMYEATVSNPNRPGQPNLQTQRIMDAAETLRN